MQLTIRLLGTEVLHISTDVVEGDDPAEHLSGGTLGCNVIDAGPTDHYMGFTNGRSSDDEEDA